MDNVDDALEEVKETLGGLGSGLGQIDNLRDTGAQALGGVAGIFEGQQVGAVADAGARNTLIRFTLRVVLAQELAL